MPAGRPTAYKHEYAEQAYRLCLLLRAEDKQLAEIFEVSEQTINTWKDKHPEFLESIKAGKTEADAKVSKTLYEKAMGGDTTAMIFWLKNRQSLKWRDRSPGDSPENPLHSVVEFVSKSILDKGDS